MQSLIHIVTKIGYIGILAIVFLESGIPLTFFLPGDSLLFTVGLLASQGYFSLYTLIEVICLGALLGSLAGFIIGKKLGHLFVSDRPQWWFSHARYETAKKFFDTYGPMTIVVGRFVPVVRSFAPSIAGALGMPKRKFALYSVLSALIWSVGMTSIGFYLGNRIPKIENYITPIIVSIVFISVLPALYEWYKKSKRHSA